MIQTPASAANLRVKARQAGPNGNYWYAVELEKNLKKGEVQEVSFWGTSIALYRGESGEFYALANRCAHRHIRLTIGHVDKDCLTCIYHGWRYAGDGECVEIAHEIGPGRKPFPRIEIRAYPVQVKYGLVWLFPGDPELADAIPLPSIPVLDDERPWPFVPLDLTFKAHFSMVIENGCDFYHAYLHRKYKPFTESHLESYGREEDSIQLAYTSKQGEGWLARLGTPKGGKDLNSMDLWYQYPYQGSDMDGNYIQWLFVLPIDQRTTRCFYLFLWGPMVVPGLGIDVPFTVRRPILRLINSVYLRPLLLEDQVALEEEQQAVERELDHPSVELNPIIRTFQELTVEKWEEYLDTERRRMAQFPRLRQRLSAIGAGLRPADLTPDETSRHPPARAGRDGG